MRQIVLDTETTGLEVSQGHRVIEIACVEMANRRVTDLHYHRYLQPDREIDEGAMKVHGITPDFLADKPRFAEVAGEFIDFIRGAELIIHNAPFDVGFLDRELALAGFEPLRVHCAGVVDTLRVARELRPGKRNSLDALCEHFQVDNSGRTLHGALLDARLLADVYLAMTRGQESLIIDLPEVPSGAAETAAGPARDRRLKVLAASAEELAEHERVLADIDKASGGRCVWRTGRS